MANLPSEPAPAPGIAARLRFGESVPQLHAREDDSDTAWNLWTDAVTQHEARFAPTLPDSLPLTHLEQAYAVTTPLALLRAEPEEARPVAPAVQAVSLDQVLALSRRNNRICPQPAPWKSLYAMLPRERKPDGSWEPAEPLVHGDWERSPSLPKRMCFRQHVEWAARQGCLAEVHDFLLALEEDDWQHFRG